MDYFINEDIEDIFDFHTSSSSVLEAVQFKCKNCGYLEYIQKNFDNQYTVVINRSFR